MWDVSALCAHYQVPDSDRGPKIGRGVIDVCRASVSSTPIHTMLSLVGCRGIEEVLIASTVDACGLAGVPSRLSAALRA